jgi:hypothetical protein
MTTMPLLWNSSSKIKAIVNWESNRWICLFSNTIPTTRAGCISLLMRASRPSESRSSDRITADSSSQSSSRSSSNVLRSNWLWSTTSSFKTESRRPESCTKELPKTSSNSTNCKVTTSTVSWTCTKVARATTPLLAKFQNNTRTILSLLGENSSWMFMTP